MSISSGGSTSAMSAEVKAVTVAANEQALVAQSSEGGGSAEEIKFSSLGEFQAKYPKLYEAFMQSFAYSICRSMQSSNERIVAEQRKTRASS